MSNERLFARNIPFAQGETQHDKSIPEIQETRNSSTIGSSTHPASQGPRNQGESSRANPDSSTIGGSPHSASQGPRNQGESSQANADSLAIVNGLDGILDDFRNKRLTKPRTIALLTSKLDFDTSRDEPEKDAALTQYLNAIESIERLTAEAAHRGTHAARGLGDVGNTAPSDAQPVVNPGEQTQPTHHEETEAFVKSLILGQPRKRGRDASVSDDEEDIIGEDGELEESSNKKRRVFEKDMPWFRRESTARQSANPSCTKTREILTIFARDYATVKHWITVSLSAPCGFPTAEWDNIIKGKSVNLD